MQTKLTNKSHIRVWRFEGTRFDLVPHLSGEDLNRNCDGGGSLEVFLGGIDGDLTPHRSSQKRDYFATSFGLRDPQNPRVATQDEQDCQDGLLRNGRTGVVVTKGGLA